MEIHIDKEKSNNYMLKIRTIRRVKITMIIIGDNSPGPLQLI